MAISNGCKLIFMYIAVAKKVEKTVASQENQ